MVPEKRKTDVELLKDVMEGKLSKEEFLDMIRANKSEEKQNEDSHVEKEKKNGAPGVYLSDEEYNANRKKYLTSSAIKDIIYCLKSYYDKYVKGIEQESKTCFTTGSVLHTLVLEPEKFDERYTIGLPSYDATNASIKKPELIATAEELKISLTYRDDLDEKRCRVVETRQEIMDMIAEVVQADGKQQISKEVLDVAKEASERALNSVFPLSEMDPRFQDMTLHDLLRLEHKDIQCYAERTFYGNILGEPVQIKPDLLIKIGGNKRICLDLKSAQDETVNTFQKAIGEYGYYMQQWLYTEILKQNRIILDDFIFCVAGKSKGSGCAYHRIGRESIEVGETAVLKGVNKYKICKSNDDWQNGKFNYERGCFYKIPTIEIPAYVKYNLENVGIEMPKKDYNSSKQKK